LAEKVNATLAKEEEERQEEEKEKKRQDREKKHEKIRTQDKTEDEDVKGKDKDEACPPLNFTCPTVKPCDPCPEVKPDPEECPPCKECGECPEVKPCKPCRPCGPCGPTNTSTVEPPSPPGCQESSQTMTTPVAMAIGAVASLLVTGVAAAIGLILRYTSPIESGFLFLATIIIMWYLCSRYPEAARELGERVVATLRDATIALSHRVAEAIQRQNEQVSLLTSPNLFLSLSFKF
jgi:hypothetical protein